MSTPYSLGYSATLSDIENIASSVDEGECNPRQLVTLQIDGMHCTHCPKRVLEAVETYSDRLEVTDPPTEKTYKLTVSYIPEAPHFTVRHILCTISDIDKAFTVSIYHPPTLEERSHAMHRRQQWQIASRLILAVLSAIPTFIIGVVYTSLVSKDSPAENISKSLCGLARLPESSGLCYSPLRQSTSSLRTSSTVA